MSQTNIDEEDEILNNWDENKSAWTKKLTLFNYW